MQLSSLDPKCIWLAMPSPGVQDQHVLCVTIWLFFSPRGMVFVSHGVGEYMGCYEKLGEILAQNGILMFGHDHGVCFNLVKLPYTFRKGGYQGPPSPLISWPNTFWFPPPFLTTASSKLLHVRSIHTPVLVHPMGPLHFSILNCFLHKPHLRALLYTGESPWRRNFKVVSQWT